MSLMQHFAAKARTSGLITPGFGRGIADTTEYRAIEQARQTRAIRRDAFLSGKTLAGLRLDSASKTARLDAHANALQVEWAEYLARRFGNYSAKIADHMDGAAAYVQSYVHQVYGEPGTRLDATVPMASQGLTYILPTVYRIQHNDLPCWEETFLKIDRSVDPAANEYVWYEMDNVGLGRAASSYDVSTIPMVNGPIASDNKGLIVPALVGMETNFMDPRRASLAVSMGKPDFQIEVMKREACERTLAEFFDALWFGGDSALGIDGIMNHPLVEDVVITGAWSAKTALQILADLITMVNVIPNRTAGALPLYKNIEIKLPPTQYDLLRQPITSAGSSSILEYFMESFKGNDQRGAPTITKEWRLAASNSQAYNGGPNILSEDTALILYKDGDLNKDPSFVLSQPIEVPAPVRTTGVGDVTYYHARGGGMKLPDARRIKYVTGI